MGKRKRSETRMLTGLGSLLDGLLGNCDCWDSITALS